MTNNNFLYLMAVVFFCGTTFFFKDKSYDLEKQNKQLRDSIKIHQQIKKAKIGSLSP